MQNTATSPDAYADWFRHYVATFTSGSEEDRRNLALKEEHTWRVQADALVITDGLGLGGRDRLLAGLIALLHDVGRFPQYRDHRTFRDSDSMNHAALGARVLLEHHVLRGLPKEEQELVVRAVALHNVFVLPADLEERLARHVRIVRDADKLDIWRIFAELFDLPPDDRPSAAGLGLPETPGYTPGVLALLAQRSLVQLKELRCLNDFKLLQLSWIYDLNHLPALRLLRERDLIGRISRTLPQDTAVLEALDGLRKYLNGRIGPRTGVKRPFLP
jgi:hypothetical protein